MQEWSTPEQTAIGNKLHSVAGGKKNNGALRSAKAVLKAQLSLNLSCSDTFKCDSASIVQAFWIPRKVYLLGVGVALATDDPQATTQAKQNHINTHTSETLSHKPLLHTRLAMPCPLIQIL